MYSRYFSTLAFLFAAKSSSLANASAGDTGCTLVAHLGFPDIAEPEDAPYFGFHACWLEAWYSDDDFCDAEVDASWCKYENSNPAPGSESAFIANPEPGNELLVDPTKQEETITIYSAASKTTNFIVYHWYFEKDYYPNDPKWKDHLLAPTLTIKNDSTGELIEDGNKQTGWKHPQEDDVSTHTEDGEINPNFEDKFGISVTCDSKCSCTAGGYTTTFDESDHKDEPGQMKSSGLSSGGKAAIGIVVSALILAPVSFFMYKKMKAGKSGSEPVPADFGPNNVMYQA